MKSLNDLYCWACIDKINHFVFFCNKLFTFNEIERLRIIMKADRTPELVSDNIVYDYTEQTVRTDNVEI